MFIASVSPIFIPSVSLSDKLLFMLGKRKLREMLVRCIAPFGFANKVSIIIIYSARIDVPNLPTLTR